MGGNKDNMRQAMKELLGLSSTIPEPAERPAEPMERADPYFDPPETVYEPRPESPVTHFGTPEEQGSPAASFIRPGATVISAGACLYGDIRAEGDVEVLGKLKGNLEATGNVRISGKVLGDVKGESVSLVGCAVQGNITATAAVTLDEGAVVVGDVLATDFESDGKVKGNLQIARAAILRARSVLSGNVSAGTVAMSQGSRVQGTIRVAEDGETGALFGDGLDL